MVHKTPTSEKIKQLRTRPRSWAQAPAAARELADAEDLGDLKARLKERSKAAQVEVLGIRK